MEFKLTGKRVLVTGGTRGAGRATALALVAAGADVVVCYRENTEAAATLEKELASSGRRRALIRADLRDEAQVAAVAQECAAVLGGLDVVVNNAGVFGRARFSELDTAEWRRVLDTNLTAYYQVIKCALPLVSDGGSIVNLGAVGAHRGIPMSAHFTAAKAAVTGLSLSLARELGPRGIRVNTVEPGILDDPDDTDTPPQLLRLVRSAAALRRLVTAEDVAAAVLFFASDLSASITGATLRVDAGM